MKKRVLAMVMAAAIAVGGVFGADVAGLGKAAVVEAAGESVPNAISLSNNVPATGLIMKSGEKQYFRYTASENGYVRFELNRADFSKTKKATWGLFVYDDNMNLVGRDYDSDKPVTSTIVIETGMSYVIEVAGRSDGSFGTAFTVKADFTPHSCVNTEKHDSMDDAVTVDFGQTYLGVVDENFSMYRNYDYFKITSDAAGFVEFTFERYDKSTTAQPEWELQVYDSDLNSLYRYKVKSPDTKYHVLDEGKSVYIKICNNNDSAYGVLYSFKADFTAENNMETEPNNEKPSADKIKLNKVYYGASGGDDDYYMFKATKNGNLKVSFAFAKAVDREGCSIFITDASGKAIAEKKDILNNDTVKVKCKKNKKYYVRVHRESYIVGGPYGMLYTLKVSK